MYHYAVREVVKVVDGDTVDLVIDLGFDIFIKQRVRLGGINAPETRTKNEFEKQLGIEAKTFLTSELLNAKSISIKTKKDAEGKFGRVLGWIHIDEDVEPINQKMVDNGYAWLYDLPKDFETLLSKRNQNI